MSLRSDGHLELCGVPYAGRGFRPNGDGTYSGEWGYFAGESLQARRRADGSVSQLDIASFVFTRTLTTRGRTFPAGWTTGVGTGPEEGYPNLVAIRDPRSRRRSAPGMRGKSHCGGNSCGAMACRRGCDPGREWSGECRGCVWLGGATAPVPGARFRGRNRRGALRWTRLNEVVRAEEAKEMVWRTMRRWPFPDSVEWRLSISSEESGTRVEESFRVLSMPRVMSWLVPLAVPAHRDRTADLYEDLGRLKAIVESAAS